MVTQPLLVNRALPSTFPMPERAITITHPPTASPPTRYVRATCPLRPPMLTCFVPPPSPFARAAGLYVPPAHFTCSPCRPSPRPSLSARASNLHAARPLYVLPAFMRTPSPFAHASRPPLACPGPHHASRPAAHPSLPPPMRSGPRVRVLSPARPASTLPGPLRASRPPTTSSSSHGRVPAPMDVPPVPHGRVPMR